MVVANEKGPGEATESRSRLRRMARAFGRHRLEWLSEWLMEVSVLLAIFPMLDMLTNRSAGDDTSWKLFLSRVFASMSSPLGKTSATLAVVAFVVGLWLKESE